MANCRGRDLAIDEVTSDTRKITAGCLFVALKGERFDAHDFAEQAKQAGAGALLVSRQLECDLPQVVVKDTRGLWRAGGVGSPTGADPRCGADRFFRENLGQREMTAAILGQCGNTLYTAGNLNNDIGVPMTLLRLTKEHQYAVIELGANHRGKLPDRQPDAPGSRPVNNLAPLILKASVPSRASRAKGEIFTGLPENGIAILNADNNDWLNWQSVIGARNMAFLAECGQQRFCGYPDSCYQPRDRIYAANPDGERGCSAAAAGSPQYR